MHIYIHSMLQCIYICVYIHGIAYKCMQTYVNIYSSSQEGHNASQILRERRHLMSPHEFAKMAGTLRCESCSSSKSFGVNGRLSTLSNSNRRFFFPLSERLTTTPSSSRSTRVGWIDFNAYVHETSTITLICMKLVR